jgi:hypothetical protein
MAWPTSIHRVRCPPYVEVKLGIDFFVLTLCDIIQEHGNERRSCNALILAKGQVNKIAISNIVIPRVKSKRPE